MNFVAEESLKDVAYLHDGTLEGLLTCIFLAYERKEDPADIVANEIYTPRLGQSALEVKTDKSKALRVRQGVERKAGKAAFRALLKASLCDDYDAGRAIYQFVRLVMKPSSSTRKKPILNDLANPVVAHVFELKQKADNEAEKMRQFIRFSQLENGIWFARCNPNVSVIPLVMGYFSSRFNDQIFIIYDETHKLSGLYDGNSWQLVMGDVKNIPESTEQDAYMEEAWRCFYDALCVDARYNPELRRSFMPKRLWRNLPEMMPRKSNLAHRLGSPGREQEISELHSKFRQALIAH